NTVRQYNLSDSIEKIADLEVKANQLDSARSLYEESLEISRKLAQRDPANQLWHHRFVAGPITIGELKHLKRQSGGARKDVEECLVLYRKLTNADPEMTNLLWYIGLIQALDKVAAFKLQAREADLARSMLEEELSIWRKFAARDPQNKLMQAGLAAALTTVGQTLLSYCGERR